MAPQFTDRLAWRKLLGTITLVAIITFYGCATSPGPQVQQQADADVAQIKSLVTAEEDDAVSVVIDADRPLTYTSVKQPDPLAVILYFPKTSVADLAGETTSQSDLITRVKAMDGNGSHTARIEIQLAQDTPYTATAQGNGVRLSFKKPAAVASVSSKPATKKTVAPATMPKPAETPMASPVAATTAGTSAPQPALNVPKTTAWLNKIDFLSASGGKSTLVIGTTHAINYSINKTGDRKLEIRLLNTRIPAYRQRPLITTRFDSAVDRIMPFQLKKAKNESVITVELREAVPYFTEQADNMLLVHFEASRIPPKPMAQANLPAWQKAMAAEAEKEPSMPASTVMQAAVSRPMAQKPASAITDNKTQQNEAIEQELMESDIELRSLLSPRKKKYTGEKIALDFFDTDIKNVFRILREVSGKNFAIDKDVTGKVTMTLDKPVPWDQVLDLVLRMNQLGMTREGEIVRIATLETLKKEDDLRKAKLAAFQKAREQAKALEPLVTKYIPVSYSNAKDEVLPHIINILTKERGKAGVDEKNNQIIITDVAAKVRQAEEIVRRIDKVTAQVMIEAKVVEVNTTFSRELGITWSTNYGPGQPGSLGGQLTTDMAMNFPSQSTSSIGINFSKLSGVPFVLDARINAIESTGDGKILSSPKILTLDNKKAKIKQGLEFAYLERDSSGGSSVKFKQIDLLLEVTPHVTPDDRISMNILITKNDVDSITDGVPSVATNEAETELLVNDGDTLVIGGIIKRTKNTDQSGFPGLSKIPLVGWLFKNTTKKRSANELLIFITPRIVQLEQQVAHNNNGV